MSYNMDNWDRLCRHCCTSNNLNFSLMSGDNQKTCPHTTNGKQIIFYYIFKRNKTLTKQYVPSTKACNNLYSQQVALFASRPIQTGAARAGLTPCLGPDWASQLQNRQAKPQSGILSDRLIKKLVLKKKKKEKNPYQSCRTWPGWTFWTGLFTGQESTCIRVCQK